MSTHDTVRLEPDSKVSNLHVTGKATVEGCNKLVLPVTALANAGALNANPGLSGVVGQVVVAADGKLHVCTTAGSGGNQVWAAQS